MRDWTQQYAAGAQEENFQEEKIRKHERMLREVGQKRQLDEVAAGGGGKNVIF